MTKYDDVSWHSGSPDFPSSLPEIAGAVNGGMFFAWLVLNCHAGPDHYRDCAEEIQQLKDRQTSPAAHYLHTLDGKLVRDDLTATGSAFADAYFSVLTSAGQYNEDYFDILEPDEDWLRAAEEDFCPYIQADTWENYDLLAAKISERFDIWQRMGAL